MTWDTTIQAWLDSKQRRSGREHTARAYRCATDQFCAWLDQLSPPVPLDAITLILASQWITSLTHLAPATVNLKLAALTSLYNYATQVGLWPARLANPFAGIERARIDPYSRAIYPTTDELRAIIRAARPNKRNFALILTFAVTCRRASELMSMRWGDIEHTPTNGDNNRIYRFTVRKHGAEITRRAVLDYNCYIAILDYLSAAGRMTPNDSDRIFTITARRANDILKQYANDAGVDIRRAHLHGLRHAGARLRFREGAHPIDIMHLLQHSSLAVTQIYIDQVLDEPRDPGGRAAAEALLL